MVILKISSFVVLGVCQNKKKKKKSDLPVKKEGLGIGLKELKGTATP